MRFLAAMEIRRERLRLPEPLFPLAAGLVSNGVTDPAVLSGSTRATPNLTLAPV
jgi:hypothetical protein